MSAYPSLPLFTDAFIADTGHLSAQETGAYLMLMMVAWRSSDCRLPDSDDKLARWARVDRRTWLRIKPAVMEFWTLDEGFWLQKRLTKEREFVSKRAEVNRANGKHGGRPKSLENNDAANPAGSSRVSETKAPTPNPSPNREEDRTEPNGSPAIAVPAIDHRRDLFGRGLVELRRMTGKAEPQCRTLTGKWLRDAQDSAVIVLAAIDEAAANEVANPVPFIEAIVRREAQRNGSGSSDLFVDGATGGRRPQPRISAVTAALAREANRSGIGPGVRADAPRPGDQGHNRSGRDDTAVEDADWSPAGGYRAAH